MQKVNKRRASLRSQRRRERRGAKSDKQRQWEKRPDGERKKKMNR